MFFLNLMYLILKFFYSNYKRKLYLLIYNNIISIIV